MQVRPAPRPPVKPKPAPPPEVVPVELTPPEAEDLLRTVTGRMLERSFPPTQALQGTLLARLAALVRTFDTSVCFTHAL